MMRRLLSGDSPDEGAGARGKRVRRDKVPMTGPGGVGKVDVAVVRQQAGLLAGGGGAAGQLQCALMSLNLPVGVLARYVLQGWVAGEA
eukprot:CAMPEP_0119106132 /NCGR_PEP_ID=MMETSP1180-20130426/3916_1 /TAXON_ID=3052 ORGANISM="Chlamydomonas cf sp, Strain CCMP681" /NCGR_SAMPLE_ID=MMETSP1180 /ASSEMBLY_ACC=CAM_ASM_000741 /LENGTH=87 /DNA_ID=CAMNT_0007091385 /DNA_START=757 /DNA_END=1020 /DNA_ORIENTATION=+